MQPLDLIEKINLNKASKFSIDGQLGELGIGYKSVWVHYQDKTSTSTFPTNQATFEEERRIERGKETKIEANQFCYDVMFPLILLVFKKSEETLVKD